MLKRLANLKILVSLFLVCAAPALLLFDRRETGAADVLNVSDLTYGKIDVNGDGKCTYGDDWVVDFLLQRSPTHLQNALKEAAIKDNDVVDLSSYLLKVDARSVMAARQRNAAASSIQEK
jgi:hypothetical protein